MKLTHAMAVVCLILFLAGCSTSPVLAVDKRSIWNSAEYERDLRVCQGKAEDFDASATKKGWALMGAGVAVGTATAILATGGLALLPVGVLGVGVGGAAVGGGVVHQQEGLVKKKMVAQCLSNRGYKISLVTPSS